MAKSEHKRVLRAVLLQMYAMEHNVPDDMLDLISRLSEVSAKGKMQKAEGGKVVSVLNKMGLEVIADFRTAMKWGSTRLNFVMSALVAYLIANPGTLDEVSYLVPEEWRVPYSILCGFILFSLGYGVRTTRKIEK